MGSIPITRSISFAVSSHSLHAHLKADTAEAHESLERALVLQQFFDSVAGYTAYLGRFFAFQSQAELTVDTCGATAVIPDWSRRKRAHLLRADLAHLSPGEVLSPPCAPNSSAASCDVERALGVAYVIEGATLGGAVLLKRMAPLGITAERGGTFLASYGPERAQMWRQFLSTLDSWDRRGVNRDRVVQAALAAFRDARECLMGSELSVAERAPRR